MSYIDIAIIVIVALGALIGLWKGFFKTVISFFGWLVSFLIAFFLTKVVSQALLGVGGIRNFVLGTEGWSLYGWVSGFLPSDIENASGLWAVILKPVLAIAQTSGAELNASVSLLLANGIFNILVCIALFIAIRIVLMLFTKLANHLTKNKAIGALNRFFGFLVGAVKGLGFVCILVIILNIFIGASFMAPVREQIDKSVLGKPISETVVKLTDKFWNADGDLMDRLLSMAGIDKEEDTPVLTDPNLKRAELKAAFDALLNAAGDPEISYEDRFRIPGDESDVDLNALNTYTTNLKQYVTAASSKLESAQEGYTAEQYSAMTELLSAGESGNGAVYAAAKDYLEKVHALTTADSAAEGWADAVKAAQASAAALGESIGESGDLVTLFGSLSYAGAPSERTGPLGVRRYAFAPSFGFVSYAA